MAKRYLRILAIYSFSLTLGIVALNLLVDPFGFFRFQGIPSFKLRLYNLNHYLGKNHSVFLNHPDGLLMGTSSVAQGLDPDHPGLSKYASKVYNYGIAAYTIKEAHHLLLHAQQVNPLSIVVLGMGPGMF